MRNPACESANCRQFLLSQQFFAGGFELCHLLVQPDLLSLHLIDQVPDKRSHQAVDYGDHAGLEIPGRTGWRMHREIMFTPGENHSHRSRNCGEGGPDLEMVGALENGNCEEHEIR